MEVSGTAETRKHRHDPEFTAAFFTALEPGGTRVLTGKLRRLHDPAAIDVAGPRLGAVVIERPEREAEALPANRVEIRGT